MIQTESGTPIPAIQGSYCWESMCADYAGDMELLEGQVPVSVLVGENILFISVQMYRLTS
ncbi:hypothetical protein [Paenibacillus amylolyticus]|uniref:hypothetical protein n=1 Tax=Paenibacillus amylolyticus TaxID=1451 RepID=UPI000FDBA2EC|nr:hypothetical protein [Paenibacillus amylolyticus]